METNLHYALEKIKESLNEMKKAHQFNPTLYIGKTSDYEYSEDRHKSEGFPILLRIAEGIPEDISYLEDSLIKWAMNDNNWICTNERSGSAGNKEANKLYICLSESVKNDELCEYDELDFLDRSFPLKIKHE